jgi:hypothetical protein
MRNGCYYSVGKNFFMTLGDAGEGVPKTKRSYGDTILAIGRYAGGCQRGHGKGLKVSKFPNALNME